MQMPAITLQLSDELAERLRRHEERLPEILELGLRELNGIRRPTSKARPGFWNSWPVCQVRRRF
ncbi:hypothetical protein SBA4_400015 [Candidatus Sulfopaludibacter sp. SbA4]|nr:hypothetical protein SBA4_400015 [Candidatus Sulfopaludibacter sp. SbA4]